MTRSALRPLLGIFAIAAVAGAWYLFRPDALVRDVRVDEAPPALLATSDTAMEDASTSDAAATPRLLAMGKLHDVSHAGRGAVTIHEQPDGRRVLRLDDFAVDNGPDLHVYLVAVNDAWDDTTVARAGFVSLGKLKGNLGRQNYEIPAGVDLSRYGAVSIWCRRFGVNFATAPLMRG